MNFNEYKEKIKNVPYTASLEYQQAVFWLHPEVLPMGVISIGNPDCNIIKVPAKTMNQYGRTVPVIAISRQAFCGKTDLTDIVLPHSIERIPTGAFAGCSNLKAITIPVKVKTIKEGTFAGCSRLEDIYYEGTMEEWKRIHIVHQKHEIEFGKMIPGTPVHEIQSERMLNIPGNEALFSANIHFRCKLSEQDSDSAFELSVGNKAVTDFFRTV